MILYWSVSVAEKEASQMLLWMYVWEQAYLILFHPLHVTLEKQDKLHFFYAKSLGFFIFFYIFIKKCLFDRQHPWHFHIQQLLRSLPPSTQGHRCWQPAGFDQSRSESDFHKTDEESYCCSLSYQMRNWGGGGTGPEGTTLQSRATWFSLCPSTAAIFKGACLRQF